MNREIQTSLINWKISPGRKPLILRGVRQAGKTFSLKEFGEKEFENCHYFNFEEDFRLSKIFEIDLVPQRILNELRFHKNRNIDPVTDIVIFDEIQRCGKALTSLKYFCEDMPSLAICAAGSLLGVVLSGESFPVGKVTFLDLYPMTFLEFLDGIGESELAHLLREHDPVVPYPTLAHERFWELWKQYGVVGGLPGVVREFGRNRSNLYEAMQQVRTLQRDLTDAHCADIAKHSGKSNALHVERLWRNVPEQLARNVDGSAPKFRFKEVLHGLRGYEQLAGPIDWLKNAHLVLVTSIVEKVEVPLSAYVKDNRFKLYFFDVGMLGAMSELHPELLLRYGYGSYQGYVAENFVAQELQAAGSHGLYCWQGRTSEIEFLIATGKGILPLEVKSGRVVHSKSLDAYNSFYHPDETYVLSGRNGEHKANRHYVPLYATGRLFLKLQDSRR